MKRLILVTAVLAGCAGEAPRENAVGSDPQDAAVIASPGGPAGPAPAVSSGEQAAVAPKRAGGAGQVLRRYFALVEAGEHAAAAGEWRDPAQARAFAARLEQYGEFETNIADPLIRGPADSLRAEVSLQLLKETPSGLQNLADGTALLRRGEKGGAAGAGRQRWLIERIRLQPPPVPLGTGG